MKAAVALSTLFVFLGLAGCVVAPAPVQRPYYDEPVVVAPPTPRVEYYGAPPVTGQIWISGFWNWVGKSSRVGPRTLGCTSAEDIAGFLIAGIRRVTAGAWVEGTREEHHQRHEHERRDWR